jgi:PhnB protein
MGVSPVPAGYHTVTPYLIVRGAAKAIEFYTSVFGGTEVMRMEGPGGTVGHAEVKIGDSVLMLADEHPEFGALSPQTVGGSPVGLAVYVPNVDEVFAAAVAGGATVMRPLADQFYGDRTGTVIDPYGHKWTIATHIEDVSPEEMKRRHDAMTAAQPA